MAAVVVNPFRKLNTVFAPRQVAAIRGAPGAIVTNAPMVAMLAPRSDELITCLPGRMVGEDLMRPANFRKATIEPVKVTPPMRTPRYAVTICRVEMWAISAMTLPILVKTAARPTTECRAATVWGRPVGVMRRPIIAPACS
jgi:hypothetical protein